jgi:dGTPase
LDGRFEGTLIERIGAPYREAYEACAALSMKRIYRSRPVVDVELAGFRVISTLISLMIEAVQSPEKVYSKLLIDRVSSQYSIRGGSLYDRILAVLDYISGMTDVYALDLYRKINGESLPAV